MIVAMISNGDCKADLAKQLLQAKAEVDWSDKEGRTALYHIFISSSMAWSLKNQDLVTTLISHRASVNIADTRGQTPLLLARDQGAPH